MYLSGYTGVLCERYHVDEYFRHIVECRYFPSDALCVVFELPSVHTHTIYIQSTHNVYSGRATTFVSAHHRLEIGKDHPRPSTNHPRRLLNTTLCPSWAWRNLNSEIDSSTWEVYAVLAVRIPYYIYQSIANSIGGPRRKNAYEPLLLENEREAVADLLQYLESELISSGSLADSRPLDNKLFHWLAVSSAHHSLLFRQRGLATLCCLGIRRNHRKGSAGSWTRYARSSPLSLDEP